MLFSSILSSNDSTIMSVELLEDEILIDKEDITEMPPSDDTTPTTVTAAAASSSPSTGKKSKKKSSKEVAAELLAKVDAEEAATDTPAPSDKLDALSVKLPHLLSPFDSIYPRTRGGDRWTGITPDGHCMIAELEPGEKDGEKVPVLNRVYVNIVGKLEDGTTFLDFPVEELDFTLGQAQVPKGVEMAVCQMHANQFSLIRCYSDYGYSSTRRPANVPADALLFFSVRVLRWEKEKNLHEMSLDDKYEYCQKRRQIGKELFSTGKKPKSAIKQYEKAITVLESIQNHEVEMKTVDIKNDLMVLFWTNMAQCWMKIPDYSRVVELCNKALKLQPKHMKALYRRAEARKAREEWAEATKDYQTILDLAEQQSASASTDSSDSSSSPSSPSSSILKPEPIDELVLHCCRSSLREIASKHKTQSAAQRKRLDGFMKSASLYDDMPMVAPTSSSTSKSAADQPEDDYSWLNKHEDVKFLTKLTTSFMSGVNWIRSWCSGSKGSSTKKNE